MAQDRKLLKDAVAQGIKVELYTYHAAVTGLPVRKATKVIFPDGKEVKFIDRIPMALAIRQALEHRAWELREA